MWRIPGSLSWGMTGCSLGEDGNWHLTEVRQPTLITSVRSNCLSQRADSAYRMAALNPDAAPANQMNAEGDDRRQKQQVNGKRSGVRVTTDPPSAGVADSEAGQVVLGALRLGLADSDHSASAAAGLRPSRPASGGFVGDFAAAGSAQASGCSAFCVSFVRGQMRGQMPLLSKRRHAHTWTQGANNYRDFAGNFRVRGPLPEE